MAEKKVTTKTITTEELVKKKPIKRKKVVKYSENAELNKMLIENFVSLQKVLTSLSSKFDDMTKKLSEVLDLFEESAKAFVKKDIPKEQSSAIWQKEITDKIDNLFEQNKILARGLTLIHEEATKIESVPVSISPPPTSPSIMNYMSMAPSPPRGEMIKPPMRTGVPEKVEGIPLNANKRVKEEEEPVFNIQESPFSAKK